MLQALLSGVASIKAHQTRMSVIGNNLANVNTTAYKGSRVGFQDLLSQTVQGASRPGGTRGGTNPIQYGLGVLVGSTNTNIEQGSLGSTNRPTDLAIQGNGYFMVADGQRTYYTRDGSFDLDAKGDLVHRGTGTRVLGWTADADGKLDTTQAITSDSKLNVPVGRLNAVQATTKAELAGNLGSNSPTGTVVPAGVRVWDSLGNARDLTVQMANRMEPPAVGAPAGATSSWEWTAYEGATTGSPIGSSADPGNTLLYFDANGAQIVPAGGTGLGKVTLLAKAGADPLAVDVDFAGVGSIAAENQVSFKNQNGFGPGSLSGIAIGPDGIITGMFTNGLNRTLGQVALSTFSNPQGLDRVGDNLFGTTDNSGIPVVGGAKSGDRGTINAGYLEQSNVDISSEFTDLIVTQRGFQANTKIVTTVDQMLEELINMRR